MRIAINGAGVAGAALAYWLHRIGHEPTLIEQAPAFRTGGYMIDFWGVGYDVAKRMGIEESVVDASYDIQRLRLLGEGGDIKADVGVDVIRRMMGNESASLPRGDLAKAIFETVEGTTEVIFGDTISALDQGGDDGVHVTLARNGRRTFDLVVGADGLHSTVRGLVFGSEHRFEHYLGCKVAACVVDGYRPRDELAYVTYSVPNRQVGRFAQRHDRTLFLFIFRADLGSADMSPHAELHRHFDGLDWECPAILEAIENIDDIYFDVVSQIHMDRWSEGRVVLIGDAAACISLLGGEGTGLAMTEAYVLAGELSRAGGDYHGAFSAYEMQMRSFVAAKQAGAQKMIGFFATRTRFGLSVRNAAVRSMAFRPLATLFAGRIRDHIALPDYDM